NAPSAETGKTHTCRRGDRGPADRRGRPVRTASAAAVSRDLALAPAAPAARDRRVARRVLSDARQRPPQEELSVRGQRSCRRRNEAERRRPAVGRTRTRPAAGLAAEQI